MTPPMPGPWDSPKEVNRKREPKVLNIYHPQRFYKPIISKNPHTV